MPKLTDDALHTYAKRISRALSEEIKGGPFVHRLVSDKMALALASIIRDMIDGNPKTIHGPTWIDDIRLATIKFLPVRPEDADYIYSLRVNPNYNSHLSPPPPSIDAQAEWIERYIEREKAGQEFYFLIARLDGTPCGTVRLYDFREGSFCWGSWILDHNKTRYAAIESALLVYRVGFDKLGFPQSHFDVRLGNEKVIDFHKRMGAEETGRDDLNVYMRLTREHLAAVQSGMQQLLAA